MNAPVWSTACPDWERRIVAGRSLIPFKPLFPEEAAAGLDVFRSLRIVDAAGMPTIGESSRPWLIDFAGSIFGAYDVVAGQRLIREFFLLISKKNSKSTSAAGIMITALLLNWRYSAEYYILAPTKEIANNSFSAARDMVLADPGLKAVLHVQEHLKLITHLKTGALLKVIAADAETVGGKKTVGILIDEVWLFGKRSNAANMLSEATGGLVSRPEGFIIWLSTQSDEPPAGVYKDKLDYFRQVRDGTIIDPRSLAVIFEFPAAMVKSKAYLIPANFRITNPNLGLSVSAAWLEDELRKAQIAGDHAVNLFLAKHLNVEIGQNLRADRWAGADAWPRAVDPTLTLETLLARSEVCVAGIDGGGLDDLLSVYVIGREKGSRRWLGWGKSFCHIKALRRRKSIASVLIDYARAGDLTVVDNFGPLDPAALPALVESENEPEGRPAPAEGQEIAFAPDIQGVVDICVEADRAELLDSVGIDPAGVGLIVDALAQHNIFAETEGQATRVHGVSQGYQLMGPIKTAERKLEDGSFVHADQPILAWAVGNAKTEAKGNAVMITKAAAGVAKIDPLMALLDAVARMTTNPEGSGPSIYNSERERPGGFLVI